MTDIRNLGLTATQIERRGPDRLRKAGDRLALMLATITEQPEAMESASVRAEVMLSLKAWDRATTFMERPDA